jgi:hypothetical protein
VPAAPGYTPCVFCLRRWRGGEELTNQRRNLSLEHSSIILFFFKSITNLTPILFSFFTSLNSIWIDSRNILHSIFSEEKWD